VPAEAYPVLAARLGEIERRAYALGVAFLAGEPEGENRTAPLLAESPELAGPRASRAASQGLLHAVKGGRAAVPASAPPRG
jgi:hypothetical protein